MMKGCIPILSEKEINQMERVISNHREQLLLDAVKEAYQKIKKLEDENSRLSNQKKKEKNLQIKEKGANLQ